MSSPPKMLPPSAPLTLDTSVGGLSSLIAVLLFLDIVTVILRLVARRKQKVRVGSDDWLAIPPLICLLGLSICAIYGMANGFMGVQAPRLFAEIAPIGETERVYFSADVLSIIALGSIRLSALFFYRRIFCVDRKDTFGLITMGLIVLVSLWTLGYFLFSFTVCGGNLANLWAGSPSCLSVDYLIGLGYSSFILDVIVFCVPLPKVWKLHTDAARKASITVVFLLALAGVGASCARMVIFTSLWKHWNSSLDVYEQNTRGLYYQILEVGLGAIAINLPSLWFLRKGVAPSRIIASVRSLASLRSTTSKTGASPLATKAGNQNSGIQDYTIGNTSHDAVPSKRDEFEMKTSSAGSSVA